MAAPGETYMMVNPPNPKPHISFGIPFPQACAHHITNTFHASRVYVIVSASISTSDNFINLQHALGTKIVGVRRGIKPHTPWDDVLEIVDDIRKKDIDLIITLGAGSLTDGAKVINFALANNVSTLEELAAISADSHNDDVKACSVPVINIPTSLSGGEYSAFAGATDKRTDHKVQFRHPSMSAALIILDPKLSVSTPARIWISTGIRAVDHCVEGLCSTSDIASEATDNFAIKGLRLLVPSLLSTKVDWESEKPRLAAMMGVVESMKIVSTGVELMGGSHGIGHQLGPLGVGHGETSCIMLPAVLEYNHKHGDDRVRSKQEKLIKALWEEQTVAKVLESRGLQKETAVAADILDAVIRELGMPRTLADVGVTRVKLEPLAANCLKDPWLKTNPVPLVNKAQVMEILEMVIGEEK